MIDRSKLQRERSKCKEMRLEEDRLFIWCGKLCLCGRKKRYYNKNQLTKSEYYQETVIEEHYVIVDEPHEFYLSLVTPAGGTGLEIAKTIFPVVEGTELQNSLATNGTD